MLGLYKSIEPHFYIDSINYYREKALPEKGEPKVSYLLPMCSLLQAHNEMEKLFPNRVLSENTLQVIKKYYNQLPPAPGYASNSMEFGGGDRFYDDNQWIGIAAMDEFARTKKPLWLSTAREIYRFMMTAYDTAAGGGLYWQ